MRSIPLPVSTILILFCLLSFSIQMYSRKLSERDIGTFYNLFSTELVFPPPFRPSQIYPINTRLLEFIILIIRTPLASTPNSPSSPLLLINIHHQRSSIGHFNHLAQLIVKKLMVLFDLKSFDVF